MTIADDKVEKGAKLLDSRLPGWRGMVDPESLQLRWCTHCVLGQIFGSYTRGIEALGLNDEQAMACGFYVSNGKQRTTWERLTRSWRKLLS